MSDMVGACGEGVRKREWSSDMVGTCWGGGGGGGGSGVSDMGVLVRGGGGSGVSDMVEGGGARREWSVGYGGYLWGRGC